MRGWVCVGVACVAGTARAEEPDADRTHRFPSKAVHTFERAGQPLAVHKWAVPSRSPYRGGGWVGGGRLAIFPRQPDGRHPTLDGTWGWDHVGFGRKPGRVFLDFWHGRPHDPALGTYRTDGPHIPDVVAIKPLKKLTEAGKAEGGEEHK